MFAVSAPGKVILFGEHAVVYGRPAIAASIDLRTYVVSEPSKDSDEIEVIFPSVELHTKWKRSQLPWPKQCKRNSPPRVLDADQVTALQPLLDELPGFFQKAAALAFLYLYMNVCTPDTPGYIFHSTTALPVGAGLGSSASFSVALASALLKISDSTWPGTDPMQSSRNEEALKLINDWAFIGESCIHGNPSGIDNIVSTRGGAVRYQRPPAGIPDIKPYDNFPPLDMLLTSTGVPRRTAELVSGVADLNELHPAIITPMLDAVGAVVTQADEVITTGADPKNLSTVLGRLSLINHGLLVALGVSHSSLERVREATNRLQIGSTKLTGAGGGGCAITIVEGSVGDDAADALEKDLGQPYRVYKAMLGGQGVAICDDHAAREGLLEAGYDAQKLQDVGHWQYL